jgi:pyruvate/2-oxoglutarate dehydrogenase complex dihydrolipoamide acyltransferase (E2) component
LWSVFEPTPIIVNNSTMYYDGGNGFSKALGTGTGGQGGFYHGGGHGYHSPADAPACCPGHYPKHNDYDTGYTTDPALTIVAPAAAAGGWAPGAIRQGGRAGGPLRLPRPTLRPRAVPFGSAGVDAAADGGGGVETSAQGPDPEPQAPAQPPPHAQARRSTQQLEKPRKTVGGPRCFPAGVQAALERGMIPQVCVRGLCRVAHLTSKDVSWDLTYLSPLCCR